MDQHFLIDKGVLGKIIEISSLKDSDIILEIGPGKGVLTRELAKNTKKVIAVEKDEELKNYLKDLPENVEVIYENILDVINNLKFNKIISNIPYNISEPLFKKMLKLDFEKSILIIGKKFYNLFNNDGKISKIRSIFFNIKKIEEISKNCFEPKPRVNSVLISITKKDKLDFHEKIIKEFALQDDKKVKNALIYSLVRIKKLTKKQSKELIYTLDIPINLFEKNVDYLSNKQFNVLIEKIHNIKR